MKPGMTAIIATLFEPPTLGPLVDAFKADGCAVEVVYGQRTNVAWMEGLGRAETRHVVIANDDIEVYPRGFASRLMTHHRKGYTHLAVPMWRSLNTVSPDGKAVRRGPSWSQRGGLIEAEPMDKGHLFSMDRIIHVPPIPEELTIFYGDDWFYWQHATRGRCGIPLDVQVRSGADIAHLGCDGGSGYTREHGDLTEFLGEPLDDIAKREHRDALKHFEFYSDPDMVDRFGWRGMSCGLKRAEPVVA